MLGTHQFEAGVPAAALNSTPVGIHRGFGNINTNKRLNSTTGHSGVVMVATCKSIMDVMKGKTSGNGRETASNLSIQYRELFAAVSRLKKPSCHRTKATARKSSW